jgi:flavin-dependent dehydrogenase
MVLVASGARVVLLERSRYDGARAGETLPPDVRVPLERLDVWDRFCAEGHTPSPGIAVCWGAAERYDNDFIANPYGDGWCVDRNRFDAMLAAAAREAGATVMTDTPVTGCVRAPEGGWTLGAACGALSADFLIDATGRMSSFCRSLGAAHVVHDRLVALVGSITSAEADHRALIEATEAGWWYSARLPGGRLVLAFHTDPSPGLGAQWARHLAAAPETSRRAGDVVPPVIRVVSANSHRLDPIAGDGWLAVGDAASAHDPVTGLGILWALESGIAAGEAIAQSTTAAYARARKEHFERYLATRPVYYRAEGRWPHAPFWRRRHQHGAGATGPAPDRRP